MCNICFLVLLVNFRPIFHYKFANNPRALHIVERLLYFTLFIHNDLFMEVVDEFQLLTSYDSSTKYITEITLINDTTPRPSNSCGCPLSPESQGRGKNEGPEEKYSGEPGQK